MQELIVRLKALMHKAFVEKEITNTYTIGGYQFNSVTQQLDFAENIQELSHRESEILKRLCENRNEVVNSQSILLELWEMTASSIHAACMYLLRNYAINCPKTKAYGL